MIPLISALYGNIPYATSHHIMPLLGVKIMIKAFARETLRSHVPCSWLHVDFRITSVSHLTSLLTGDKLQLIGIRYDDVLNQKLALYTNTTCPARSYQTRQRKVPVSQSKQITLVCRRYHPRIIFSSLVPCSSPHRSFHTSNMHEKTALTSNIAIVGAGEVGSTTAYSLILNPIVADVLLVDPKTEVRDAQVQDLSDATYHGNTSTRVRAGNHKEAGQCDIVVITAGAAQKKGESRTDLIGRNLKILASAIEEMKPFRDDTILLLVANPVDVLTYFAQQFSGLPKTQVFGSGTFLDSARLRGILADRTGVAASSIDAYVLGEHGESQFVAWSHVSVGGVPLRQVVSIEHLDKQGIADETKQKAAAIINAKGSTSYGIGGIAASICKSILFDHRNIRPVSHWQEELGVCLSMPAVIGREGIVKTIPMSLDSDERKNLEESAKSLKGLIQKSEEKQ